MNIKDALKEVLRNALINDGLARGLREGVKALDKWGHFFLLRSCISPIAPIRRQALLCVLAKDCSEAGYVRLVEALCNEHQIKLLKVHKLSVLCCLEELQHFIE